MGLLQKRALVTNSAPLYKIGIQKNTLIIGLGNPGKRYLGTRHNLGYDVLDYFAEKNEFPGWVDKKDLRCHLALKVLGDTQVVLCKPTSFMNNSGQAAAAVQRFYKLYNPQTLAVYDDLAISFGQLRARVSGSDAGHNGVKSLIEYIGDDFGRLRIGIGSEISAIAEDADFVLGKFTKKEQGKVPLILREANSLITEYIYGGSLPHDTRTVL